MKLKNSWEEFPKKTGEYYVLDHCGKKNAFLFSKSTAQWWRKAEGNIKGERICPSCTHFQWLDEEAPEERHLSDEEIKEWIKWPFHKPKGEGQ